MQPKLPATQEEYIKMLKMAFNEGQKSMEGGLKYETFGNMDMYAVAEPKYKFEYWANQIWKYGLIQLHLLN